RARRRQPHRRVVGLLRHGLRRIHDRPRSSAGRMVMPTGAEMIARARSLAPSLAARAAQCEALRRCPDETIADFRRLDLHRALQPLAYGGCGLGWDVLVEMAIELGRGCASQAWVLSIYGDHAQWVGTFPRAAQDDVWRADPDALVCTCYAPM